MVRLSPQEKHSVWKQGDGKRDLTDTNPQRLGKRILAVKPKGTQSKRKKRKAKLFSSSYQKGKEPSAQKS